MTIDFDDLNCKTNDKTTVIFIMHYFGALQPKNILDQIKDLKSKKNFIVIEDTTHSFFFTGADYRRLLHLQFKKMVCNT